MKYSYVHSVILILSILFITTAKAQVQKTTISPFAVVSTNMDELSKIERTRFISPESESEGKVGHNIFPIQPLRKTSIGGKDVISNILGVISPAPTTMFQAQPDVATSEGFSWIPPDTWGAVGKLHLMSVHNNNVKIQDKTGVLSTPIVSLATFWSTLPGIGSTYDPKIVYDPYNDRWIMVTLSDPDLMTSSILVAISNTNDPTGVWTEYKYVMGVNIQGKNCWADYPCIGFNKNWVGISVNMFTIAGGVFQESRILVISYPDLLATLPAPTNTLFSGIGDFTVQPCITYSATEEKLYAPNSIWGAAAYRLNTITGTSNAPVYNMGVTKMHTVLSNWVGNLGEILPQIKQPEDNTVEFIDADDDRINNAVFRNDSIYYSQTVGLPAGNLTHTAVQWVVLDKLANYTQGGRIEDPNATNTNGLPWYAYPSINVNGFGDILLGFSQFSSTQAAASGYCLKDRTDALSTMRDPRIFKPGISFYWKTFSGSRNRWGDFSFVQPDPSDDYSFWTIQEYADTKVGVVNGSGRWGTWWAKVQPVSGLPVELTSFISNVSGRQVNLRWETKTEVNFNKFEIERSLVTKMDGPLIWAFIGTVQASGSSNSPKKYSYSEKNLQAGKYQYRLKMIDNDGSYKYSSIAETEIALPKNFDLSQNYPNPFNPSTRINYNIPIDSRVILEVFSITGRRIVQLVNEEQSAGYYSVDLNSSTINTSISSGVYFYNITTVDKATGNNFTSSKKMIYLK